jgi:hypothetical protein
VEGQGWLRAGPRPGYRRQQQGAKKLERFSVEHHHLDDLAGGNPFPIRK